MVVTVLLGSPRSKDLTVVASAVCVQIKMQAVSTEEHLTLSVMGGLNANYIGHISCDLTDVRVTVRK